MRKAALIAMVAVAAALRTGGVSGQHVANLPVSVVAGDQTEPSVAVNPNDPQHVIVGAIDVPTTGCRYFTLYGVAAF